MSIKVLVADHVAIMRRKISRLLATESTIKLLGEAAEIEELVQMANGLAPQVIVMDLNMAGNREQGFRDIKSHLNEGSQLIAISFANDAAAKLLAKSLGAAELLDKMYLAKELIPAILRLASAPPIEPEG
jgi:two-component system chemotaxis response regulator CheB